MSNPMDYKVGELVRVTTPVVRIAPPQTATGVTVTAENGIRYVMPPGSTVERVAPAEWPPRPGDLWRDREGDVWFAVEDEDGTITMVCQVTACVSRPPDEFMRTLDPLTFVYREDEQDGDRS